MANAPKPLKAGYRHFLTLYDLTVVEFDALLERANDLKQGRARGSLTSLEGKTVALVFEKASTRTRVSFEVGVHELGGHSVYLSSQTSQLARGEPVEDSARVLGAYCHAIVYRTFAQGRIETMAAYAGVPVINGLSDLLHPCQVASDLFTVKETDPNWKELTYAWVGDGNNMAHSWIRAAALIGLKLRVACPKGFEPATAIVAEARQRIQSTGAGELILGTDPAQAVRDAHVVSTDVWASMGQEDESEKRRSAFQNYCVDDALLRSAHPEVLVLHCLPAHRGEEISSEVLEGRHSAVWRQAENRLHVQKAILELCFGKSPR
jgi:ornithine carbamoyltransferase